MAPLRRTRFKRRPRVSGAACSAHFDTLAVKVCGDRPSCCLSTLRLSTMQDGVIMLPELVDGVQMYSVFDGHGEGGGLVTQWAIQNLPGYVGQAVSSGRAGELLNRITDAYRLADDKLETDLSYKTIEDSGTTVPLPPSHPLPARYRCSCSSPNPKPKPNLNPKPNPNPKPWARTWNPEPGNPEPQTPQQRRNRWQRPCSRATCCWWPDSATRVWCSPWPTPTASSQPRCCPHPHPCTLHPTPSTRKATTRNASPKGGGCPAASKHAMVLQASMLWCCTVACLLAAGGLLIAAAPARPPRC